MDYESADRWNQQHPVGTLVSIRLQGGACFEAKTTSRAQQWGSYAIVSLEGHPGMWTTSAMKVADPGLAASDPNPPAHIEGHGESRSANGG